MADDNVVNQVSKDLNKVRFEKVKTKVKENYTKIVELQKQITLLEVSNKKIVEDYNAGLD